jgi:short-subunit dehydrogenase
MEFGGARVLVAGATGVLGAAIAGELSARGARIALAGRNAVSLASLGDTLDAPVARLDFADTATIPACVHESVAALGGLDALVVASGVAAFGPEPELGADTVRVLFAVNAVGPIELIRTALEQLGTDATVVGLTAVVAEHPTAGMAAYSASKAALSAYLAALRRERRRSGLTVLDVRPTHLDTGFETRALAGSPPDLPAAADHRDVVTAIVDAMRDGRRELAFDLRERKLIAR